MNLIVLNINLYLYYILYDPDLPHDLNEKRPAGRFELLMNKQRFKQTNELFIVFASIPFLREQTPISRPMLYIPLTSLPNLSFIINCVFVSLKLAKFHHHC